MFNYYIIDCIYPRKVKKEKNAERSEQEAARLV